jgi:hypothetical protein
MATRKCWIFDEHYETRANIGPNRWFDGFIDDVLGATDVCCLFLADEQQTSVTCYFLMHIAKPANVFVMSNM